MTGTEHRRGQRIDQVRNGNRWCVLSVDAQRGRIAAQGLTDSARVIFEGDYMREHITLGYAATVASSQGMIIGNSHQYGVCRTILSDRASRAMAYVGADTAIHQMRRGTKNAAAAHYFRTILANDDRARTMHTVAARIDRQLLPTIVAALLDRNDQRRSARIQAWLRHSAQTRTREAAFERIAAARQQAQRQRSREQGYRLEL